MTPPTVNELPEQFAVNQVLTALAATEPADPLTVLQALPDTYSTNVKQVSYWLKTLQDHYLVDKQRTKQSFNPYVLTGRGRTVLDQADVSRDGTPTAPDSQ